LIFFGEDFLFDSNIIIWNILGTQMPDGVVQKTFAILELISNNKSPVSLSHITEKSHMPKPTVCRILKELQKIGYVEQNNNHSLYQTTQKLRALGQTDFYEVLKETCFPFLKKLNEKFNETVNLGVREGSAIRYIQVLETTRSLRMMVRPDTRDEIYSTALGRAILAFSEQKVIETSIKNFNFRPFTEKTVKNQLEFKTILKAVKKNGYAVDDEENEIGVICFSVPLLRNDSPIASMSITLPKIRCNPVIYKKIIHTILSIKEKFACSN